MTIYKVSPEERDKQIKTHLWVGVIHTIPLVKIVNKERLCAYMSHCPTFECEECIGIIPKVEIELIEPELNGSTVREAIKKWEVLRGK